MLNRAFKKPVLPSVAIDWHKTRFYWAIAVKRNGKLPENDLSYFVKGKII
jgi:hypothetical protein